MTETPATFIATQSAVLRVDGDKFVIRKDITRVDGGHPMVAAHPGLFREVDPVADVHYRAPGSVETARQEPVIPDPAAAAAEQAKADDGKADDGKKRRGGNASS